MKIVINRVFLHCSSMQGAIAHLVRLAIQREHAILAMHIHFSTTTVHMSHPHPLSQHSYTCPFSVGLGRHTHQSFSFCSFSSSSGVSYLPSAAFCEVASACRIFLRRFLSCFSTSCDAASGGAEAPEFCSASDALVAALLVAAELLLACGGSSVLAKSMDEGLAAPDVCDLLPPKPGGRLWVSAEPETLHSNDQLGVLCL